MYILSVLEFTYRVIIDRCINHPGHGRFKLDSTHGSENSHLRRKMCMIGTGKPKN